MHAFPSLPTFPNCKRPGSGATCSRISTSTQEPMEMPFRKTRKGKCFPSTACRPQSTGHFPTTAVSCPFAIASRASHISHWEATRKMTQPLARYSLAPQTVPNKHRPKNQKREAPRRHWTLPLGPLTNSRILCHRQYSQPDARRMLGRPQHAVRGLLIVVGLGQIDIGHELLRIAIDQREPGALDLDH